MSDLAATNCGCGCGYQYDLECLLKNALATNFLEDTNLFLLLMALSI